MAEELNIHQKTQLLCNDVVAVPKHFIDLVDRDFQAAILLSQIFYWFRGFRLTIEWDGRWWLCKGREEWWDEVRLLPKQVDRCLKVLEYKGFIEKRIAKFHDKPMIHIWLDIEKVWESFKDECNQ